MAWTAPIVQIGVASGATTRHHAVRMARLTEAAYLATMSTPMTLLMPEDDFAPIALGEYVTSVPEEDLEGHDFAEHNVDRVYREPGGRFIHVLLASATANVFLVIVVDEPGRAVHGHYLLDLNKKYGLS